MGAGLGLKLDGAVHTYPHLTGLRAGLGKAGGDAGLSDVVFTDSDRFVMQRPLW